MTPSVRLRVFSFLARHIQKPILERTRNVAVARARVEWAARTFLFGRRAGFRSQDLGGVPCRVLDGRGLTIFYIHGGAYALFSARTHQGVAAGLAVDAGWRAVLPDYRRAPEHPFPAAVEDVERAYLACAAEGPVALAGDSAGGGLVFGLLHRILERGHPPPVAAIGFSPWTDLTLSGDSLKTNADADPMLPASRFADVSADYLAGADRATPEASPLFGQFAGAPPCLIQVGTTEVLFSDAERLAARLQTDGVQVTLDVIPRGLHAFQMMRGWIPEADAALARARAFLQELSPGA